VPKQKKAKGLEMWQCAQCGAPIEDVEKALESCRDCLFLYCEEHAETDTHDCYFICMEREEPDAEAAHG